MQENNEEYSYLELIDTTILDNIFKQDEESIMLEGLKKLKQFIKDNKPTFDTLQDLFKDYFELKHSPQSLEKNLLLKLPILLPLFGKSQTNSIVYKSCMNLIHQHKYELQDHHEKIRKQISSYHYWQNYNLDALPNFIQTFDLQEIVSKEEVEKYLDTLIEKEKFADCVTIIQAFGSDKALATKLIKSMTRNKTASKAADYLKKFHLDPQDFPELLIRLKKNSIRYFMKEKQWYQIEDDFKDKLEYLGYAAEDYFFQGLKNEAYSIITRNNLIEKKYIQKQDILSAIQQEMELQNLEILENPLIKNDALEPLEEIVNLQPQGTFLSLQKDLKISEQNIYYIDSLEENDKNFQYFQQNIFNEEDIGLDTEFQSAHIKLDEDTNNKQSIIQLADSKNIYIIDVYQLKEKNQDLQKLKEILQKLLTGPQNKIGVGVASDCNNISSAYNMGIQVKTMNKIELQKIFLKEYKGHKQSNLAYISKTILGKPISKAETVSDWMRRPLRQSQIHYAALDAIVSVKIIQKIREKLGDKLVSQYIIDKQKPVSKNNNKDSESDDGDEDFIF